MRGISWPWATGLVLPATALLMFVLANADRLPKLALAFGCVVSGTSLLGGIGVVVLPASRRAIERVFGVAITPRHDQKGWAHFEVRNRGKPDSFQVQVEEIESYVGGTGLPYHAPWRENNGQNLRLVRGERGTANIAEVISVTERSRDRDMAMVRFYSIERKPDGFFDWTTPVGTVFRCRISVLRSQSGPLPGEYRLEVLPDGVEFKGAAE